MTLIVDASALYAQANRCDPNHTAILHLLNHESQPFVTSEVTLAEADYLILSRLGVDAELMFLSVLAEGRVTVDCLTREEFGTARILARRYRDLELGLADCSLIVLAYRHDTRRIATLNFRHFRAVTPLQGGVFTVLPADG